MSPDDSSQDLGDTRPTAQGRGRPRQIERRAAGEGLPYERHLAELPATTRCLLDAARRILLARGTRALTLEAVASEAHVDVTTIHYHFGSKAGLLEALFDSLSHETLSSFAQLAGRENDPVDRLQLYFGLARSLAYEAELDGTGGAYYELLTYSYRDPLLRQRLAKLNRWYVDASLEVIFRDMPDAPDPEAIRTLARLIYAAVDGISVHYCLDPDGYPLTSVIELVRDLSIQAFTRLVVSRQSGP